MNKTQIIARVAALRCFADYKRDTGISAAAVVDDAELVVERQAPASFNGRYPATRIQQVAAYMVRHREPPERAYLFA